MNSLILITALTLITLSQAAELWVYSAGTSSRPLQNISRKPGNAVKPFCARDFSVSAISIFCIPDVKGELDAKFFIGTKLVKSEMVRPFTIAGDYRGNVNSWSPPGNRVVIRCKLTNGETVIGKFVVGCSGPVPSPDRRAPTPPPRGTAPPAPATVSSNEGITKSIADNNCITIPAADYANAESDNTIWKSGTSAGYPRCMVYKFSDSFPGIVQPGAERSILGYRFTPSSSATYLITTIMKTDHGTEHNDIWMKLVSGGFTLRKNGASSISATGWTKGYHNRNGLHDEIFSVDFNAHTFTADLTAGQNYVLSVAGRSTKVGLCGFIMFPCSGSSCLAGGSGYRSNLDTCKNRGS